MARVAKDQFGMTEDPLKDEALVECALWELLLARPGASMHA